MISDTSAARGRAATVAARGDRCHIRSVCGQHGVQSVVQALALAGCGAEAARSGVHGAVCSSGVSLCGLLSAQQLLGAQTLASKRLAHLLLTSRYMYTQDTALSMFGSLPPPPPNLPPAQPAHTPSPFKSALCPALRPPASSADGLDLLLHLGVRLVKLGLLRVVAAALWRLGQDEHAARRPLAQARRAQLLRGAAWAAAGRRCRRGQRTAQQQARPGALVAPATPNTSAAASAACGQAVVGQAVRAQLQHCHKPSSHTNEQPCCCHCRQPPLLPLPLPRPKVRSPPLPAGCPAPLPGCPAFLPGCTPPLTARTRRAPWRPRTQWVCA